MKTYVHQKEQLIYGINKEPLRLEGVGLNGWLLPEGYMFKSIETINRPRHFYQWTEELLGKEKSDQFWKRFRETFITEADIKEIKKLGFNSVRVPFDYAVLFEPSETRVNLKPKEDGLFFLDSVIRWCHDQQIYVILDLHGAPGGQTGANIDNSVSDHPDLFTKKLYQEQTVFVWTYLANRYKDEIYIAAYDLLNEPLPKWFNQYNNQLIPLYQAIIKGIRSVDPHHMITLEGTHWATEVDIFKEKLDSNILIQFHKYWSPFDTHSIRPYLELRDKLKLPIFMGEGGEHHLLWYSGAFKLYQQYDISWNFWSYKKMTTDNSLVSFNEPTHWQSLLKKDATLTEVMIEETCEAFLKNIEFESCTYHQDVANHLLSKDDFEVFGIAFDLDKRHDFRWDKISKAKYSFREFEGVVVVDENNLVMTPDFSLGKTSGVNTPFPYLRTKINKEYPYAFYISKDHTLMSICVEHKNLWAYQLKVDGVIMTPSHRRDHEIKCHLTLDQGWHQLSVLALEEGLIKKIQFKQL
jgi:hypothetical protein